MKQKTIQEKIRIAKKFILEIRDNPEEMEKLNKWMASQNKEKVN